MLDAERATARTLGAAPWLPLCGLLVAVAWILAQVVAAVPVMLIVLPRDTQMVFALPLAGLVSVVVLPPGLSGLYAAVRAARDREGDGRLGLGRTLQVYVGGVRSHAEALTRATVVYRIAALVPAAVALVVLLAGDTAVNYWQYANGVTGQYAGFDELRWVWLWAMLAGGAGRLVLVFYDLPVLFGGVSPRRCWRIALRFARRRPSALLRYGAVRLVLWSPMVVVVALEIGVVTGGGSPVELARSLGLFLVAALGLGTVSATLVGAYHVVVYRRIVEPVLREPAPTGSQADVGPESALVSSPPGAEDSTGGSPDGLGRRRLVWAVVALVVVAAASGTAAVRVSDTRPMPDAGPRPVASDATADKVTRAAALALGNDSYREHRTIHRVDADTGERRLVWDITIAVDRRDRRARLDTRVRTGDGWSNESTYASETRTGLSSGLGDGSAPTDLLPGEGRVVSRRTDGWTVLPFPGYRTLVDEIIGTGIGIGGEHDLAVVERTDDRVVLADTRRPNEDPPDVGRVLVEERVRLVVDADTGRPRRIVIDETFQAYENGTESERYRVVETRTFTGYGDPKVERPDAIGPRGSLEWLWDLVYY